MCDARIIGVLEYWSYGELLLLTPVLSFAAEAAPTGLILTPHCISHHPSQIADRTSHHYLCGSIITFMELPPCATSANPRTVSDRDSR